MIINTLKTKGAFFPRQKPCSKYYQAVIWTFISLLSTRKDKGLSKQITELGPKAETTLMIGLY